jgi:phosphoglycolate phosphatase
MTFRLVLFDFDGTLADSLPWFGQALRSLADEFNFKRVSDAEMEQWRDCHPTTILANFGIPLWKMPRIAVALRRLMRDQVGKIRLFDGIEPFLRRATAANLALGIVSSNDEANVRAILGPANAALFQHWQCGVSLFGKASRLRRVAKAAGIPLDRTLYIGDELRDLEAAAKAGMAFGAVSWGCSRPSAFAARQPHVIFQDVAEMTRVLV